MLLELKSDKMKVIFQNEVKIEVGLQDEIGIVVVFKVEIENKV